MPAEWAPHEATWLAWPHDYDTWPQEIHDVETAYLQMIAELHQDENVRILVGSTREEDAVLKKCKERGISKNISLYLVPTNSVWIRDYGPLFVTHSGGNKAVVNCQFNAWGKKYHSFKQDDEVPSKIAQFLNLTQFKADLILEGGSIDVNGEGTLLTTEECLLNPNRNPNMNRKTIEQFLKDFFGIKKIIWLGRGIEGDDTDGHIDEVARFAAADKIVLNSDQTGHAANDRHMKDNWQRLKYETGQNGKPLELVALPMPKRMEHNGTALPGSYTNFYIGNGCVLVPSFKDPNDGKALSILRDLFPKRRVVGVPAIPLIYGQGAIHCATQQEPNAA